jgi:VIT1/CCC1 family predicted Fe2+/Mn2+ transporter
MKSSIKTGFSFGLTSGIITTLGLMVGLHSGTHSRIIVIGGILTIAIADAFSDALGIHVSEESENVHTTKELWEATVSTFLSKLIFALTFIIPVLIFNLSAAIIISVIWGLLALTFVSYSLARGNKKPPWKVITEHLIIALVVIIITHFLGNLIAGYFS